MEREPESFGVDPESERPPILPEMPVRPERPADLGSPTPAMKPATARVVITGSLLGFIVLSALLLVCTGFHPLSYFISSGIFVFAALHYIIWGWWLGRMIHEEEAEAQRETDRQ